MQTVAIVGTGLIGASFGLALRKAGFRGRILGVSSPGAIREALEGGAIDEGLPLDQAAPQADLVYLAQTISRILGTLEIIDPVLKPGALVTDAGSTKAAIVSQAIQTVRRGQFLGGHPLAGKEQRGAAAAAADLFRGRTYVLTPVEPSELETPAAVEFRGWLSRIGALPVTLRAEEHDRIVAYTSHLPQLASTALGAMLGEHLPSEQEWRISGPGLQDSTRLALSSYEIWGDILATNREQIDEALANYIARLEALRAGLATEAAREEFGKASGFSGRLRSVSGSGPKQ